MVFLALFDCIRDFSKVFLWKRIHIITSLSITASCDLPSVRLDLPLNFCCRVVIEYLLFACCDSFKLNFDSTGDLSNFAF